MWTKSGRVGMHNGSDSATAASSAVQVMYVMCLCDLSK